MNFKHRLLQVRISLDVSEWYVFCNFLIDYNVIHHLFIFVRTHHLPVHAPNPNHAALIQCPWMNQALENGGLVTTRRELVQIVNQFS